MTNTWGREHRRCEQCHEWFEIGAKTRKDAKYCKDACKSKAYRERKERALALYKQRVSIRAIARALDSEARTIRKWVEK